ncbi:hypothetical protein KGQ19_45620 [Catenulispora sp. NL8]|uniref:histidine kinase n=1 Tax=Catenulispora pinistramenti TaxID=2705254 RepID=A0ABS5L758_9ACTN|nr:histidine kinase [Catenulispora pinistramenti]MBS2554158.1 hypothetical protein [Catenulispora pinistramenti]
MRAQPPVPGQRAWVAFDVAFATAVTALSTWELVRGWSRPQAYRGQDYRMASWQLAAMVAGVVLSGAALAARRWRPLPALAVVLAAWLAMLVVAWPMAARSLSSFEMISALLLYSVAVTETLPVAVAALAVVVVGDTATVVGSHRPQVNLVATMGLAMLFAWALGLAVARYRDIGVRLREQQDAAARAELDRERVRLARELHDVLAHSMSVVNVQAGYGRFAIGRDPAAVEAALAAIQTVSAEAMTEMRGMLAVLRDGREAAALTPAPRLRDLSRLVTTCAEAGVSVRVGTAGTVRELPDGLELAAFRIVQEALTNVVKHAHTRAAQVLLEYQAAALEVTVTDAGRGGSLSGGGGDGDGPGHRHGSGHGLAGITERVGLYEGTVEVGPLPGGGWRVRAMLPCPAAPADPGLSGLEAGDGTTPDAGPPAPSLALARAGERGAV